MSIDIISSSSIVEAKSAKKINASRLLFDAKEGVIYKTDDYAIFKVHRLNDHITPQNLKKIKNSISSNNLTHLYPIKINRSGEILDGHHRYKVCKDLGLSIYFMVSDQFSVRDIARVNTAARVWKLADYLDYYCQAGHQSYIDFRDVYDTLLSSDGRRGRVGLTKLINMSCSVCSSEGPMTAFKDGKFTFDKKGHLIKVLRHAREFEFIHKEWTSGAFLGAISLALSTKGYDPVKMLRNARKRANYFFPVTTTKDYIDILEPIYNFNTSEKHRLIFRRRYKKSF